MEKMQLGFISMDGVAVAGNRFRFLRKEEPNISSNGDR